MASNKDDLHGRGWDMEWEKRMVQGTIRGSKLSRDKVIQRYRNAVKWRWKGFDGEDMQEVDREWMRSMVEEI